MAGDWQKIQLGKVCLKIGSGATPRGGKNAYRGGNTALIRSQNIYNDRFTQEGLAYINDFQARELRNVAVEKNDVLLNITGDSVARCCQVDPDVLPARVSQHVVIIRTQPDVLNSCFLRYVLVSPSMQDHLLALASAGATRNALTKVMIESLVIQAPLIEEQRAIAHILGILDDKIELNRQMSQTLEQIAQALFKSWFVNFDPVRAKMALKTYSPLEGESACQARSAPISRWGEVKHHYQRHYTALAWQRAKTLRKNQTDAEGLLWHYLRGKQLGGFKFRRQQAIGQYIADFACMSCRLVVELDGSQHGQRQQHDQQRDHFLQQAGFTVLRFWNNEVFEHALDVLERIYQVLIKLSATVVHQPPTAEAEAVASTSATPPQGGSEWTVERAKRYLATMPPDIAALFPDTLVHSDMGWIPEGWKIITLGDLDVELESGRRPKGGIDKSLSNGVPSLGAESIYGVGRFNDSKIKWVSEEFASQAKNGWVQDYDVAIYKDGANVGDPDRVAMFGLGFPFKRFMVNEHVFLIRSKELGQPFLYQLMQSHTVADRLKKLGQSKAAQPGLNQGEVLFCSFIMPKLKVCEGFNALILPFLQIALANSKENQTLVAIRDLLLPKLISGELRVPDTGKLPVVSAI